MGASSLGSDEAPNGGSGSGGTHWSGERTMEQQARILDGDLETLGLHATLKMLALGGKTGILSVVSGQERMRIALQDGHIVALEEIGVPLPDLVEMYRLLGRLPRSDAARIRQMSGNNPATSLTLLVQYGFLTPEQVQGHIEFGIIQALSRAVRWERGRFDFQRDVVPFQGYAPFYKPLDVDHVLLEAMRLGDEYASTSSGSLSRNTVARWMPQFNGDIRQLGLEQEAVQVLCMANGQLPLSAVAYGLLLPEHHVTATMQNLLSLGLIELVDARLEGELERNLVDLLTHGQYMLSQQGKATPEQRMLTLIRAMGWCTNGLLAHHGTFARILRGRGEVPEAEVHRYLETNFQPMLVQAQRDFPRMEEIVRFERGRLVYQDLEGLDRVVRGQELVACYWDGVRLLFGVMRQIFTQVLADEAGQSRIGHQFEDLWAAFLRELEEEIRRLSGSRAAMRA